ncbi:polysaccharide biosynthesis/export family protein [Paraferrimonas haliotis]|nr:polysaccharide biosynthesis/export family protein [Paraferrimonas haliotis]
MILKRFILAMVTLCAVQFSALVQANSFESTYKLGPGDKIMIEVFGEEELTFETLIGSSGRINYPFLGQLTVKGLTVEQLKDQIVRGLKGDYLLKPNVHVRILEYRPFFVNGEVKRPGGYPYQPNLTVNTAIALAGGFTERASKNGIYLSNSEFPNREPKKVGLNHKVQPGDILVIDQSFF